ncbi:MAG: DUF2147 domain-containing protein [Terracidiphilus sp.]|jgi:uncharacterized protein (DUF2147 family)
MRRSLAFAILFSAVALASHAQNSGIMGDWKTPLGSIISFNRCGQQVCAWILYASPSAPSSKDIHNPDSSLRDRPLCGMKVGSGFTLNSPTTASGGLLYDPKTGRTYHSKLAADGNNMVVHGYYGIALLSGSETWTHADPPANPCAIAN